MIAINVKQLNATPVNEGGFLSWTITSISFRQNMVRLGMLTRLFRHGVSKNWSCSLDIDGEGV